MSLRGGNCDIVDGGRFETFTMNLEPNTSGVRSDLLSCFVHTFLPHVARKAFPGTILGMDLFHQMSDLPVPFGGLQADLHMTS